MRRNEAQSTAAFRRNDDPQALVALLRDVISGRVKMTAQEFMALVKTVNGR